MSSLFIPPILQFIVGLAYAEELTTANVICSDLIWLALGLFNWDAWRSSRMEAPIIGQIT